MALKDLVIRPRTDPTLPVRRTAQKALRYASGALAEFRLVCGDLLEADYEPAKRRKIVRSLRGRSISAKATVDDAIEAIAMEARQDGELVELAERCEAATGPDRELNIAMLPLVGLRFVDEGHPIGQVCYDINGHGVPMPQFTASLDAAMTLVPEGWFVADLTQCNENDEPQACVTQIDEPCHDAGATGATMTLALCAAALRARAALEQTHEQEMK